MFVLPDLPYPHEALAPTVSADTLRTHHGKHHAKYVEVMNQLLQEKGLGRLTTVEEVVAYAAQAGEKKLFNNAAQAWNHAFFWDCMTPNRTDPGGALAEAVARDFGGLAQLREQFVAEGVGHFASGWVWLIARGQALEVISTHDAADTLTEEGVTPLLVCDLWEHAYYLDYKQDRKGFLEQWFDRVANWSTAEKQYAAAGAGDFGWRYPPRME